MKGRITSGILDLYVKKVPDCILKEQSVHVCETSFVVLHVTFDSTLIDGLEKCNLQDGLWRHLRDFNLPFSTSGV